MRLATTNERFMSLFWFLSPPAQARRLGDQLGRRFWRDRLEIADRFGSALDLLSCASSFPSLRGPAWYPGFLLCSPCFRGFDKRADPRAKANIIRSGGICTIDGKADTDGSPNDVYHPDPFSGSLVTRHRCFDNSEATHGYSFRRREECWLTRRHGIRRQRHPQRSPEQQIAQRVRMHDNALAQVTAVRSKVVRQNCRGSDGPALG
jgi:hypothetical protein